MNTTEHILTLDSIAGYATEDALWQLLGDLCRMVRDMVPTQFCELTPDRIVVDGKHFELAEQAQLTIESHRNKFQSPELLSATAGQLFDDEQKWQTTVWTIGALLYYCSSGRYVFGGRGGDYQRRHPEAALPSLRREHSALSEIVGACLKSDPVERITIDQLEACCKTYVDAHKEEKAIETPVHKTVVDDRYEACWPEEFVPLKRS